MKGTKYLSQIGLTPDRFVKMKVNLIECPPGAGKTHFCPEELPKFVKSNRCILYLIDTRIGKEQIINHNDNTIEYSQSWRELMNETPKEVIEELHRNGWGTHAQAHITVMTYAKAGAIIYFEHPFDWSKFDYVVCDELHNLIKWQNIKAKDENGKILTINILKQTQRKIEHTLYNTNAKIIALTATPGKVRKVFKNIYNVLEPLEYNTLYRYEEKNVFCYSDFVPILNTIPIGTKGIIFFYHISQLKKAETLLVQNGHRTTSIWSAANKTHTMTDRQKEVITHIIKEQKIPESIDIILINAACETGINIKNKDICFVLVHSTNKDTVTQVRGRVRNDLEYLYFLSKTITSTPNPVPEEYLNKPLTAKEKEILCVDKIRYLSKKGEPYKWGKTKKYLESNGYKITDKTIKNVRYSIIEKRGKEND